MATLSPKDVTQLLLDWSQGDKAALDHLMPLAYDKYRRLASRIVELRSFGGLMVEETTEALEVSPATVEPEWSLAKAWLCREINRRRGA